MAAPSSCVVCMAIYSSFLIHTAGHHWCWGDHLTLDAVLDMSLYSDVAQLIHYGKCHCNHFYSSLMKWTHHSRGETWLGSFYPRSKHFQQLLKESGTTQHVALAYLSVLELWGSSHPSIRFYFHSSYDTNRLPSAGSGPNCSSLLALVTAFTWAWCLFFVTLPRLSRMQKRWEKDGKIWQNSESWTHRINWVWM